MNGKYEKKNFSFGKIDGLSKEQLDLHLKLYEGYVNHINKLYENICDLMKDREKNLYTIMELNKRIGFELGGVLNHELYFGAIENGKKELKDGKLKDTIATMGGQEMLEKQLINVATNTRGIGWTLLVYDKEHNMSHMIWVSDHELGNVSLPAILAIDMWEHSYLVDYKPSEKAEYVKAYLNALDWEYLSDRFQNLV